MSLRRGENLHEISYKYLTNFSRENKKNILKCLFKSSRLKCNKHKEPASVAQLDAPSDWRPGGLEFNPDQDRQNSSVEIDHEIFSMVILSLPLIQEGQLSVSGKRMCTILVNRIED